MFRITSRYIVREVVPPFLLSLLVFTFLLLLPPIRDRAEELIGIGIAPGEIGRMLALLVPQSLGITIPMGLLLGVLIALGRLSSDHETVAMQACGISFGRILAPLLLFATIAAAVNCWIMVDVVPRANHSFRELVFRVMANRAEGEVKPRVFHVDDFPNFVLYVQEASQTGGGWSNVFLADVQEPNRPDIYVAERGQVVVDAERQTVDVALSRGTRHHVDPAQPEGYERHAFEDLLIQIDATSRFPVGGLQEGYSEMTIPELRERAAEMQADGLSPHWPVMYLHQKFSIPVACFVFVLLGAAFGISNRRDGRLASFALGIGVIFAYWIVMYTGEAMAMGQRVSPHLARWLPNIVLGIAGIVLVWWRTGRADRRLPGVALAARLLPRRTAGAETARESATADRASAPGGNGETLVTVPTGSATIGVSILDWYVTRMYLRWVGLAFIGLLGIFYITTFIELSDNLFKEQASGLMLLEYLWYATPQFVYYVLPIAGLVATLVTIGVLTRTSELTVMKACGISLYRVALPILAFSLIWSGCLFMMAETVLARANRHAEALNQQIRTGRVQMFDPLNRRWLVDDDGDIYHYLHFDPDRQEVGALSIFEFEGRPWSLTRRTFVAAATFGGSGETAGVWEGRDVWERDFSVAMSDGTAYRRDADRLLPTVAPPEVFAAELPEAELMSFRELQQYIDELRTRGFDVVGLVVALHRKASFPFVTVILTLIAIPFAVTTGRRGTLYGVGVGIALAFTYWIVVSIFAAFGSAGILTPIIAAWAPNAFFGASAGYFLFAVRT